MQNVLIISPGCDSPLETACVALRSAGHDVKLTSLDRSSSNDRSGAFPGADTVTSLCDMFDGRPPDILLVDLSKAHDCLPIRHASLLLQHMWGSDMPRPVCLALLAPLHLAQREWLAHTDDFLLLPYQTSELLARVEMLLFRKRHVHDRDRLSIGDLTIDLAGGRALDIDGLALPLTPREFDLLRFLATHRGKFFARDRLLDMVWGVDFDGGERTVDIHIRRLRAKLPASVGRLLETHRGVGYGLLNPNA